MLHSRSKLRSWYLVSKLFNWFVVYDTFACVELLKSLEWYRVCMHSLCSIYIKMSIVWSVNSLLRSVHWSYTLFLFLFFFYMFIKIALILQIDAFLCWISQIAGMIMHSALAIWLIFIIVFQLCYLSYIFTHPLRALFQVIYVCVDLDICMYFIVLFLLMISSNPVSTLI